MKENKTKTSMIKKSRRDFVKNTALFTGGAMLLPNLHMSGMANVLGNKKLKLALVGCGGRGTGAAVQALTADDNVELVAMADAFEDRLKGSLANISKAMGETKKINVKEKNQFVGFDAATKAMDLADVVILATPLVSVRNILNTQ
ncbi:hypothetical protein [Zobellia laminariae]|uniref:hypothetical protein n=1 Tax=Zobellia laminariae TaxID=248906 RepID=UPI0026F44AB5|nr:hypothetical protein [Zobellia laminariae]WKX75250.1 hypothetical protein Q5W13_16270 [Zobellia laminariae]